MQELQALIKYIQINKATDSDWFNITSSKDGIHWSVSCSEVTCARIITTFSSDNPIMHKVRLMSCACRSGKCWYVHELIRYDFDFEFDVPATYPSTAPEIQIPELDGKTAKMYRGGKICLTVHFKPLWAKNR